MVIKGLLSKTRIQPVLATVSVALGAYFSARHMVYRISLNDSDTKLSEVSELSELSKLSKLSECKTEVTTPEQIKEEFDH